MFQQQLLTRYPLHVCLFFHITIFFELVQYLHGCMMVNKFAVSSFVSEKLKQYRSLAT